MLQNGSTTHHGGAVVLSEVAIALYAIVLKGSSVQENIESTCQLQFSIHHTVQILIRLGQENSNCRDTTALTISLPSPVHLCSYSCYIRFKKQLTKSDEILTWPKSSVLQHGWPYDLKKWAKLFFISNCSILLGVAVLFSSTSKEIIALKPTQEAGRSIIH